MWETMLEREILKAERVIIKDSVEEGARRFVQLDTQPRLKSSPGHEIFSQIKASPPVSSWSQNTANHTASMEVVSMETGVDKHKDVHRAEVSSGCSENRASEDRMSPTNSTDLFPTPASSRESLLSEGWDKEKSWFPSSSVTSPCSFSRTVSPCLSVRSGVFSPGVIQIKKHFLAPGSSLVNIPQTCFSSCDSLSSSACPQTRPPRHRPPVTRLSLLTAILRKGRLPVLSAAQERPYTPCWPVNPVSLSSCKACSAASSVASIPLQLSSQFSSSTSIDSQNHIYSKPTASDRSWPPSKMERCSEQVILLPPVRNGTSSRTPLPLLPNFNSSSPPKHENSDFAASAYSSFSKRNSPHADTKLKELIGPPSKLCNVGMKSTPQSKTPLSKLRLLSQHLKSPPVSPHPPTSIPVHPALTDPAPPLQNTIPTPSVWVFDSDKSFPVTRSVTPSQASGKAHCLSPSRYTAVALPGWRSPISPSTPTPSLAPPVRNLTPSPSVSLRSTPSPRPGSGISDYSDGEGKKRKTHKIKSSYKSLAAIPTNNLLLDQQEGKPHYNEARTHFYNDSNGKLLMEKRSPERSPFSVCELHIKEPDEISHPRKGTSVTFSRTEELQIHI